MLVASNKSPLNPLHETGLLLSSPFFSSLDGNKNQFVEPRCSKETEKCFQILAGAKKCPALQKNST
jgi:hypothetical protein